MARLRENPRNPWFQAKIKPISNRFMPRKCSWPMQATGFRRHPYAIPTAPIREAPLKITPNHTQSHLIIPNHTIFRKKHVFDFMNHLSHPDMPGAKRSETGLPGVACEAGSNSSQTGVQPGSNPSPISVQPRSRPSQGWSRLVKPSQTLLKKGFFYFV